MTYVKYLATNSRNSKFIKNLSKYSDNLKQSNSQTDEHTIQRLSIKNVQKLFMLLSYTNVTSVILLWHNNYNNQGEW